MRITKVLIDPHARDVNTHELRPLYQRSLPLEIEEEKEDTVICCVYGHEMYRYEFKKEHIIKVLD